MCGQSSALREGPRRPTTPPVARTRRTMCPPSGASTAPHYAGAWAWAGNAPVQWGKQVGSHLGGTRDGMVVAWPERIRERGGLRSQFAHCIDIGPPILEAAGIPEAEDRRGPAGRGRRHHIGGRADAAGRRVRRLPEKRRQHRHHGGVRGPRLAGDAVLLRPAAGPRRGRRRHPGCPHQSPPDAPLGRDISRPERPVGARGLAHRPGVSQGRAAPLRGDRGPLEPPVRRRGHQVGRGGRDRAGSRRVRARVGDRHGLEDADAQEAASGDR